MGTKTSAKLKWLRQRDPLPEMLLHDLIRLMMEGFALLSALTPKGKNYAVRFSNQPNALRAGNEDFRSIVITTHNRNGISVSPLCLQQLLAKFEITDDEFRKQYNRLLSQEATGTNSEKPT